MRAALTIILLVAGLALIFSVSSPMWTEVQILKAEQAVVEDTLARLTELQGLRDELLTAYNSIPRERLRRLEELVPPQPEVETLLISLESVAAAHGLSVGSVAFSAGSAPAEGSTANPVTYSFSVNTSYPDFKEYLASLEKSLRLVDVKNISFSLAGAEPGTISLQAASYYKPR